jgi:ATP synthase protein I
MAEPHKGRLSRSRVVFSRRVGAKEKLMLKAKRAEARNIWLGLRVLGLIGWSVAAPTLVGIAVGAWIDNHFASRYSWTLMLLVVGLVIGCLNAWRWAASEYREIRKEREEDDRHEHR